MANVPRIFLMGVAVLVLLAFGGAIVEAGRYTLWIAGAPRPADLPPVCSYLALAVNAILAANLGALLGINISLRGWAGPREADEWLQWAAAGWYVIMLVLATVFWGLKGFSEDPAVVVPMLPELAKNGIGILISILAAALGVQTAVTRNRRLGQEPQGGQPTP